MSASAKRTVGTLTSALSTENRRDREHDPLRYYLDRLHAEGGPKLEFDDARLNC
jgi:hypothetical protein